MELLAKLEAGGKDNVEIAHPVGQRDACEDCDDCTGRSGGNARMKSAKE